MPEAVYEGGGLCIAASPGPRKIVLRYLGAGAAPADLSIDGLELPREIGRAGAGEPRALRLGPGEWLALGWEPSGSPALPAVVVAIDVSDGLLAFDLEGRGARALLAAGCSLDFDACSFAPGMVARTRFARSTAIVECVAAERFALYADRSIGAYLSAWLAHHAPIVEAMG